MEKIKIGIIPAAGQGKRMGDLSRILPKCLLPLYDKPLIVHIIENMKREGIEEIYVPIFFKKELMKEYLTHVDFGITIHIIELERLTGGIALTIGSAEKYIKNPFMVVLGDDCTISKSLNNLTTAFFKHKCVALEGVVREQNKELLTQTCCLELNKNNKILEIIEKPSLPSTNTRGIGIYMFSPDVFDYIKKTPIMPPRNEVEITNTIRLIAEDGKAYAEFIKGLNININTAEDLFRAWAKIRSTKFRDGIFR
jgi:dTDP-glucose pyrophosphorylase